MSNIEQKLKDYLVSTGIVNEWYEGEEDDEEDRANDLLQAFLSQDYDIFQSADRLVYIDGDGGGEGEGEYVWAVFKFDGVFYKAEWNYYSHHGYDFEGLEFTEVAPKEKTITVYDPV